LLREHALRQHAEGDWRAGETDSRSRFLGREVRLGSDGARREDRRRLSEAGPQGPQGPAGKGKRTAKWLPRGNGIVVSEETTVETDKGPVTSQLTRKWILSPDGTTLTIDMYHDTPRGQFETKRIFIKKAK
jgi:hypothetical protein